MRVLIVDDQRTIRVTTAQAVRAEGHEPETADNTAVALLKLQEDRYDLIILDLYLQGEADGLECLARVQKMYPHIPVVISTAHASVATAVEAMRRGAQDYLEKPFTPAQIRQVLERTERARRLRQRVDELEEQVAASGPTLDFHSEDAAMAAVVTVLERAASTRATVLILGENGTGKTALARHVHALSTFSSGPFVTVSCPSLSKELLESELFGHMKGSFTGALKDTWGKVEAARGGTLFLDEIGELPAELQPKLLRLLQERTYERIGETKTRAADVRVIAATNRDLAAAVKAGTFREDLFYRLNVIGVTVPPLRLRPRDLQRHTIEFLRFFAEESGRAVRDLAPDAWRAVACHAWPGNLRELRNSIERAVILAPGARIERSDLPAEIGASVTDGGISLGDLLSMEVVERAHIERVIARTSTLEEAARVLELDAATIYRKRKRWAAATVALEPTAS